MVRDILSIEALHELLDGITAALCAHAHHCQEIRQTARLLPIDGGDEGTDLRQGVSQDAGVGMPATYQSMERIAPGIRVPMRVRLTTLAPDLVAAILDDDLPDQIRLFDFSAMDPVIWDEQRALVASLIAEHESIG